MKRENRSVVLEWSRRVGHTAASIIGLAVFSLMLVRCPAWGQNTWPGYPANSAISVTNNGSVGIGITNPQHLLHVAGTIGAEEVIVSPSGADYVFDPGYRLMPLTEVSAFIQENHHLPEIPSTAEGKAKGVGLGDMQTKLLAKVEELTLHVIRLDAENRELKARISQIEGKAGK